MLCATSSRHSVKLFSHEAESQEAVSSSGNVSVDRRHRSTGDTSVSGRCRTVVDDQAKTIKVVTSTSTVKLSTDEVCEAVLSFLELLSDQADNLVVVRCLVDSLLKLAHNNALNDSGWFPLQVLDVVSVGNSKLLHVSNRLTSRAVLGLCRTLNFRPSPFLGVAHHASGQNVRVVDKVNYARQKLVLCDVLHCF